MRGHPHGYACADGRLAGAADGVIAHGITQGGGYNL